MESTERKILDVEIFAGPVFWWDRRKSVNDVIPGVRWRKLPRPNLPTIIYRARLSDADYKKAIAVLDRDTTKTRETLLDIGFV